MKNSFLLGNGLAPAQTPPPEGRGSSSQHSTLRPHQAFRIRTCVPSEFQPDLRHWMLGHVTLEASSKLTAANSISISSSSSSALSSLQDQSQTLLPQQLLSFFFRCGLVSMLPN